MSVVTCAWVYSGSGSTFAGCVSVRAAGTCLRFCWETLEPSGMAALALKSLLFLLPFIGCCSGDVLPPGPVDAKVGKNVTLKTLITNPQYDLITWTFNDGTDQKPVATVKPTTVKVGQGYEGRVLVNTTNGFLTLLSLKSEDSGDYSINVVFADLTTKTGETKLRVLEPVSTVVIKSNRPDAIEHNSTVILTCSAKGSFLKFQWLKGNTPIVADGIRLSLKDGELSSELTIRDVLRSDFSSPIYCTVSNRLDVEKSPGFNLTVYYGPEAVTLNPANPPKFIESGSNFNLTCSAQSMPPATFSWYRNKQLLESSGPVLTLSRIESLEPGKTADYNCKASNAKTNGNMDSNAVSFGVMKRISDVKITGPTAILIAGNSSANLSCQAAGGTIQTKEWLKDGKPLAPSPRVVIATDLSSVAISPLLKEDNGVFTCQFINPINTAKADYKMVVNYGPEEVKLTGPAAVEVDNEVTLTCSAASVPPATYTWKLNNTDINFKNDKYVIKMATYKQSGTYTCEAYNAITRKTAKATHILSVKEEGALDGLSDGAIAGIVIAVLIAVGAAIGLFFYCRQKVPLQSPY